MPWYRVGTVTATAGQTTITGVGTNFSANSRVGDAFQGPDGRWYEVTNIASATVMSILPAYQGATVAGGAYGLAPMQGYVKESADRLRQIVEQWGGTLASLGAVATESIVPIAKGGTAATTAAAARANLGLGDAATRTVGTGTGNVMAVGSGGLLGAAPASTDLHVVGNTEFRSSGLATNSPPGGAGYYTLINIRAGIDNRWTTIFAQEINSYRLAFKTIAVDQSSTTNWSMIYHTNNTTRAADGTLKAI
ncbi:hypothetical protein [Pseudomonas sp. zfem002]|uniref:hypothetical protein n=1 Tax=Pseudomonas sp. zfem002 TaxID=3078197 RepID=UPI002928C4B5|nr:hypothetical protein [Pseudomonas sp. zfem002]MDU9394303.1 hypothetical protein [Pseudomonas sp. zfem002]